jgi:hypothetical protein
MSTRTVTTVVDDLDGSTEGIGTYRFALEHLTYEIDLSADNVDRLRTALAPFIAAGRRLPNAAKAKPRSAINRPTAEVRTWWAINQDNADLPPHRANGPIPPAVYTAYRAAAAD